MDPRKWLLALRFVGWRTAGRAVRAAWERDQAERIPGPPQVLSWQPIDPLEHMVPLPDGARFTGPNAELEIRFLAPEVLRLSWTPGLLPLPYAIVRETLEETKVSWAPQPAGWMLESPAIRIEVNADGRLRFQTPAGRLWREEDPPERRGEAWRHRVRLRPEERLYGLGERAAPLNRRGRTYRMWNRDPGGSYGPNVDPLYLGVPLWISVHAEGVYLVFYENPYDAAFDLGASEPDAVQVTFAGGALRYYVFYGSLEGLLARYTELTGRPPLPPRWALGFHQSRWSYGSAEEVREVVRSFREHHLPLHALHLDIDYMDGYRVFTVDRQRFPDLAGLIHELEGQGVRTVVILDPGVKIDPGYSVYQEGMARRAFCRLPDGRVYRGLVWPGWCVFPDFTDPSVREWWGAHYQALLEMGVAGFWHDMNEPTTFAAWGEPTFPRTVRHEMEGRGGDHLEAHNLYGLLMNRAAWEALRRMQPDRRPFLLTRSGWAGIQRYAWNWTGDTESTWAALRQTIATVIGLGLSGIPYTGPDIGGFSGAPSAELFIRWFQAAAFMPFFRNHAAKGTPRREPWVFGEPALSILREFLELRVRLLPYLYTLAWEAAQTGAPLVRPLFWGNEDDASLGEIEDAFLLGPALLVAPVVEEGARARKVFLPSGEWYDFWEDRRLAGPGFIEAEAPLERIPVFVRAGSVLPMAEDGLTLHLYAPSAGEGEGTLYSDAGDGFGPYRVDRFRMEREEDWLWLRWIPEGDFPWPWETFTLRLHGFAVARAVIDGQESSIQGDRFRVRPFQEIRLEEKT
ncbi:glycoside hydrolase family 31 protein [Thermoflexus sp.]|uniref:glycoside hydrolase family 31 protein n=1 Tax=Thermoflexus sp. TaxID=1969742 RepID=UPI0025E9CD2C|nr:glycoside hydrolase family 31 protein [Thermoflexus sp.]MCS7350763.1 glycoside hydrolase family 31 protein [Thermoflexus sp.]MDW8180214.1 glycoside hydrolase family 31 protein [Anaerolineae bacterium]